MKKLTPHTTPHPNPLPQRGEGIESFTDLTSAIQWARETVKPAFTLAEVLITLAIIGIVAALTIPTLVTKIQKHIYYNQFMKARSVIENALRLHAGDHDCPTDDPLCNRDYEDAVVSLSKYFKGAQLITDDNADDICKGYDKLPIAVKFMDINRGYAALEACSIDMTTFSDDYSGFITMDGLLFIFSLDVGYDRCFVDTNGPNSGPNIVGRDIFYIELIQSQNEKFFCGNPWGMNKECYKRHGKDPESSGCYAKDPDKAYGDNCGARLIEEGKMTY